MKKTLLLFSLLFSFVMTEAKHITGGEMIYEYTGPGSNPGTKKYRITLRLFRDENCFDCAVMPVSLAIGVFNNDDNSQVGNYYSVNLGSQENLATTSVPPCITNPPNLKYTVGYYLFSIVVPDNANGYTITYQTCCRIDNIRNVPNSVGATYYTQIPGMTTRPSGFTDNSPQFSKGISVVCFKKPFILDFSASDPDADSLVYSLCDATNGGAATNASFNTPAPPPYGSVSYTNGYSGSMPLGNQATINPATGIISGVAPNAGKYVVSVCIRSYRNGAFIGTHRKDFIITVAACDFAGAQLYPNYNSCDGFTFTFENLNTSPLNQTFYWDFGDGTTSTDVSPTHTYTTAGIYTLKLVVNRGNSCSDSSSSPLSVFPGYFPGFAANSPVCKDKPLQFTDMTTANYGVANSWRWNFGNTQTLADTSRLKNPVYTYTQTGDYDVTLIVASDKGCVDTVVKTISVVDKPDFTVSNDTLICSIDTLRLQANSPVPGTVTWTPNYNINSVNSFTPLVSPDITTTYTANFIDNSGCVASQSVIVKVIDQVSLYAGDDTTICRTDGIQLNPNSDGLQYSWTPSTGLSDPNIKNPVATTNLPLTTYRVIARVGKCSTEDEITIRTVPYPNANAGKDTSICYGQSTQLFATGGSLYTWTPEVFLSNPTLSNPMVQQPPASIAYIVTVRDVLGCPKAVQDTVIVTVIQLIADAGPRDTSVVSDQPLQLQATGGTIYNWTPSTWLNSTNRSNPISLPQDDIRYIVTVTNEIGCKDVDTIQVHYFKVKPDLYIPTAFSPNADGTNDILKPIALGIKSIEAFKVFNRWGQLMYSTTVIGEGWDGRFGGNPQEAGTYIWQASGTDYRNKKIERKGSVVLIR